MDWEEVRSQAKRTATGSLDIQVKRYMVGIIILGKDIKEQELADSDFVWIKAHSKITAGKLRQVYMEKQKPNTEIDLQLHDNIVPQDAVCKNLDRYGDRLVILQAVEKEARRTSAEEAQKTPTIDVPIPHHVEGMPIHHKPISPYTEMLNSAQADGQVNVVATHSDPISIIKSENQSPPPFENPVAQPAVPPRPSVHREAGSMKEVPSSPIKSEESPPSPAKSEKISTPAPETETPFDPSQVFTREISQEADNDMVVKTTNRYIAEVVDQDNPEILEAGVAKALEMLSSLKSTFTRHLGNSPDAAPWVTAIEKLENQANRDRVRTVIGVVGNTGAGKSSVINALLDEERLVPTNCMRACTAVVTSISNNPSTDPFAKYRAEVQFVEAADWEKELRLLMTEFLTENGTLSSETKDPNSDAGIAWSKFRAVYPKIPKDMLENWTVENLMKDKTVLDCLGTTKHLQSAYPDRFYMQLQRYVDSKEKPTGKKEKKEKDKSRQPPIEYWPLIKEVRIYTKAKALETGAVIVDLPGVHDSNAARAAVAERYMKQCTGLWIVAPITRAVDDKAAKNLLGDTFKRQLKYDGNYSNVTFICSKTDDISITEATDSLYLHDKISALEGNKRGYQNELESIKEEMDSLKESVEVYKEVMDSCDQELETWEDLKDSAEDGKTVFAPSSKTSSKRKRRNSNKGSSKRRHTDDDDFEYISSGDDESTDTEDTDEDSIEAPKSPLTLDEIKQKIIELRQTKKNARQEKAMTAKKMPDLKQKAREIEAKMSEVRGEMTALCIAGRNAYSKGAIQQDFAAGIKELDMENAEEEDEENFDPDKDRRDYDEVAQSLPVFCVSSRAYQKMSGRLQKDGDVPGFTIPAQTEIPQLQEHCKQLTVAGRIQYCRRFLVNFISQLTTFAIWASNGDADLIMTDDDRRKQRKHLQMRLDELDKGLEQAVAACVQMIKKDLRSQIFDQYPKLINEAVQLAPGIAHRWGYKSEGGVMYATYMAICRRAGVYNSASAGLRDFNGELTNSIIKQLASGWERAFQNRIPNALVQYTDASSAVLRKFHEKIEDHALRSGVGLATLSLLKGSIANHEHILHDHIPAYLETITEAQRDANRSFIPTITSFMERAYYLCTSERGPGSYLRMKGHMTAHVEQARSKMFAAAAQTVEAALIDMCSKLDEMLSNNADETFASVRASYMHALTGGVHVSHEVNSSEEKALRVDIIKLLNIVDDEFEPIAKGDSFGIEGGEGEEVQGEDTRDGAQDDAEIGEGEEGNSAWQIENVDMEADKDLPLTNDNEEDTVRASDLEDAARLDSVGTATMLDTASLGVI